MNFFTRAFIYVCGRVACLRGRHAWRMRQIAAQFGGVCVGCTFAPVCDRCGLIDYSYQRPKKNRP